MDNTITRNFDKYRGDTFAIRIKPTDSEYVPDELHLSCKKRKSDTNYVFHKTIANGGVTLDSDGWYTLKATPTDMDLQQGQYHYDVQWDYNDDVFTVMAGMLTIREDVTK